MRTSSAWSVTGRCRANAGPRARPRRAGTLLWVLTAGLLSHGAGALCAEDPPTPNPGLDYAALITRLRQEVYEHPGMASIRQQLAVTYNNYGVSFSSQGQWDQAVIQLKEALRLEPDNPEFQKNLANIYLNQASEALKRYRPREAKVLVQQALQLTPEHVEAYSLLGEIEYGSQRLKEARAAWKKALELDPSRQELAKRLEQVTQELPVESNLERLPQAYFDFRYASTLESPVSYEIRDALLQARKVVGGDFALWPSYKLVVLLYSDEDFRALRKEKPEWVAGEFDGKIRVPVPEGEVNLAAMKTILFHEYTHALVHDLTGGQCPTWLNEGLAEYEGRRHMVGALSTLTHAMENNGLVPWARLDDSFGLSLTAEQVRLAYEQSYSILRYLVERYGFWRIRRVLRDLSQGMALDAALAQEFHIKVARLEDTWRKWLPGMLEASRSEPAGTP